MSKFAGFFASLPFVTYRCNKILKLSTHLHAIKEKNNIDGVGVE